MKPIAISILVLGIVIDPRFLASSIPQDLREELDKVEVALENKDATAWPSSQKFSPRQLVATQLELDFKRLTELVNEPSTKPVLVVKLPGRFWPGFADYYIFDGHHRVASARLRGVDVEAVVVG